MVVTVRGVNAGGEHFRFKAQPLTVGGADGTCDVSILLFVKGAERSQRKMPLLVTVF